LDTLDLLHRRHTAVPLGINHLEAGKPQVQIVARDIPDPTTDADATVRR